MAELKAPPSRYRIIERDRRLIVIDTQLSATDHAQRSTPASQVIRSPWANTQGAPGTHSAARNPSAMQSAPDPSSGQFTPSLTGFDTGKIDDWLVKFAAIAAESKRDPSGRLVLRTRTWFDPQAPRHVALDVPAARKLGWVVVMAIAIPAIVLTLISFGKFFYAIVAGFVLGGQIGRPAIKAGLESLVVEGTPVRVSDLR